VYDDVTIRLNRETARFTQPLYSSGFRLTKASMRLTAAVATPCILQKLKKEIDFQFKKRCLLNVDHLKDE